MKFQAIVRNTLKHCLGTVPLLAALAIPLNKTDRWTEISFGKIPINQVTYSSSAIVVHVKKSASPLVFKMEKSQTITGFDVHLKLKGDLSSKAEPAKIEEDSLFRLGLVAEGSQTLSGVKKLFAPDWVKSLFALAPPGAGLDKIYFFNLGRASGQLGLSRSHPKSDLMLEKVVAVRKPGEDTLTMAVQLDAPLKVSALWISIDGDDTKSEYETTIENITLQTKD